MESPGDRAAAAARLLRQVGLQHQHKVPPVEPDQVILAAHQEPVVVVAIQR